MARKQFGVNMTCAIPNSKADLRYRRNAFERQKSIIESDQRLADMEEKKYRRVKKAMRREVEG